MPQPNTRSYNTHLANMMQLLKIASELDEKGELPKAAFSNEFDTNGLSPKEIADQKQNAKTAQAEVLAEHKVIAEGLKNMSPGEKKALEDVRKALKTADTKGTDGKRPDPQAIIQNFLMGLLESTHPTTSSQRKQIAAKTEQLAEQSMNDPEAIGTAIHLFQAAEYLKDNKGYGERKNLFEPALFDDLKKDLPWIQELTDHINPTPKQALVKEGPITQKEPPREKSTSSVRPLAIEQGQKKAKETPKWVTALATFFKALWSPIAAICKAIESGISQLFPKRNQTPELLLPSGPSR